MVEFIPMSKAISGFQLDSWTKKKKHLTEFIPVTGKK
jgi:hypothetical protein